MNYSLSVRFRSIGPQTPRSENATVRDKKINWVHWALVTNAVVLWNTLYMQEALSHLRQSDEIPEEEQLTRLSPLINGHVNMLDHYTFSLSEDILNGEFPNHEQWVKSSIIVLKNSTTSALINSSIFFSLLPIIQPPSCLRSRDKKIIKNPNNTL